MARVKPRNEAPEPPSIDPDWVQVCVYVDGGLAGKGNPGPGAAAAVIVRPDHGLLVSHAEALERVTNNEAEYRSLLLGIRLARIVGADVAHFVSDSELVVNQVARYWAINKSELCRLHGLVTGRLWTFRLWSIQHVGRERNAYADMLCNRLLRPGSKAARNGSSEDLLRYVTGQLREGWKR